MCVRGGLDVSWGEERRRDGKGRLARRISLGRKSESLLKRETVTLTFGT